jgi:hypothetical protein
MQRACFELGNMDPGRKRRLDDIGFDFTLNLRDKVNEEKWSLQFKKLRDYYVKHGHCELVWDVDRFTIILNTLTNTPPVSLPALQVKCHTCTRKMNHWATGSTSSVHASNSATWIQNEKGGSTKSVSISRLTSGTR